MAEPTWTRREVPILEAIAARSNASVGPQSADVVADTGLSDLDVSLGLRALEDAGYVTGVRMHKSQMKIYANLRLQERGRRATGQWPADSIDSLVALLAARIASEPDAETRSRLERLRDAIAGMGRDVAVSVLSEWAKGVLR
jgi:DNA-binding transcriptional ArsR family regulator